MYSRSTMPGGVLAPNVTPTTRRHQMGPSMEGAVPCISPSAFYQQPQTYAQPIVTQMPQSIEQIRASKPVQINTLGYSQTIFIWKRTIETDGLIIDITPDFIKDQHYAPRANTVKPKNVVMEILEEFSGTQEFGNVLKANPIQAIDEVMNRSIISVRYFFSDGRETDISSFIHLFESSYNSYIFKSNPIFNLLLPVKYYERHGWFFTRI